MPVSCCGHVHHCSSPRRLMDKTGIGICLSQPRARSKVGGGAMLRVSVSLDGVEERDEEQEEDGEEELRDGGIPFIVNRGGLPVNKETWEQMWRHVARNHPEGEEVERKIRGATDLPKVSVRYLFISSDLHLCCLNAILSEKFQNE